MEQHIQTLEVSGREQSLRLFMIGNQTCLQMPRICIVGPRKPSFYGITVCKTLVRELSSYEIATCSGLALGIDTIVHAESIRNNMKTIAIPGSSLESEYLYPKSNSALAREIVRCGGALLSPWKLQRAAPWTFPFRNKILAELCDLVLVIEAGERSGTLITASWAKKLGKIICAVPGNIDSALSLGSNELIKQGAIPITCVRDIQRALCLEKTPLRSDNKTSKGLLQFLETPCPKDSLLERSQYDLKSFIEELTILELEGKIAIDLFGTVRKC